MGNCRGENKFLNQGIISLYRKVTRTNQEGDPDSFKKVLAEDSGSTEEFLYTLKDGAGVETEELGSFLADKQTLNPEEIAIALETGALELVEDKPDSKHSGNSRKIRDREKRKTMNRQWEHAVYATAEADGRVEVLLNGTNPGGPMRVIIDSSGKNIQYEPV